MEVKFEEDRMVGWCCRKFWFAMMHWSGTNWGGKSMGQLENGH